MTMLECGVCGSWTKAGAPGLPCPKRDVPPSHDRYGGCTGKLMAPPLHIGNDDGAPSFPPRCGVGERIEGWKDVVDSMPPEVRLRFMRWWQRLPKFSHQFQWQAIIAMAWRAAEHWAVASPPRPELAAKDVLDEAVNRITRTVLELWKTDAHEFSTRPCSTCLPISKLLGSPFGCDELRAKRTT